MTTTTSELGYSSLTRIAGEDEQFAAKVTGLKELSTSDVLDNGGTNGVLTLTVANTAYELKVGGSVKALRKMVEFISQDNNVFYGYSNAVTTTTGLPCFKDQHFTRSLGPSTSIWFVSSTAGAKLWIAEL